MAKKIILDDEVAFLDVRSFDARKLWRSLWAQLARYAGSPGGLGGGPGARRLKPARYSPSTRHK